MATQVECKHFNDVYEKPPEVIPKNPASVEAHRLVVERNDRNAKIYGAVQAVLENNFKIVLPDKAEDFPGKLEGTDLAKAVAILGLIHADNWQDPSNGKTVPTSEDLSGKDGVIDRRFIDAVVDAVKEYTTASDLYNNVFKLMIAEAAEGPSAAAASSK
jgi:hypothetical protein